MKARSELLPGFSRHVVCHRSVGFTLVELLVVIAILVVLSAIVFGGIQAVTASSKETVTVNRIHILEMMIATFRSEDKRRMYPAPAADHRVIYDPSDPMAVLTAIENSGQDLPRGEFSALGDKVYALVDGWGESLRYDVDGSWIDAGGGVQSTMDGVADRPHASLTDWNPNDEEPFVYVWSLGDDSEDQTDPANWIYAKGAGK